MARTWSLGPSAQLPQPAPLPPRDLLAKVPNRCVTTLAAGHTPWAKHATASPHADAHACSTSRTTSEGGRTDRATPTWPRPRALVSNVGDRARVAGLAIRTRVPLAVARQGVGAATATNA